MTQTQTGIAATDHVIVIGAGIAGLSAAARLAHAGCRVTVLERHAAEGGKIRTLPSSAGPVDTGPTVLTLRDVFDDLFATLGERLEDHVQLVRQPMIARHFWRDGAQLDLFDDRARNCAAIRAFAGARGAAQFTAFADRARELFEGFDRPMLQAARPSVLGIAAHVAARPRLARRMAPLSTLDALLRRSFDDPRLVQLFGRYATYVGGSPYRAPALLSLIWEAESAGVWAIRGGMHKLAHALRVLATRRGAVFRFGADVREILVKDGRAAGVMLAGGERHEASTILFNGDPRALAMGAMGAACAGVAPQTKTLPRSLSAEVWAFAARPSGLELAHHNVFFRHAPKPEFDALERGEKADDPTLYICAMERGLDQATPQIERFEIIANAAPLTLLAGHPEKEDFHSCQMRIFQTLARFGLTFDPMPDRGAMTTPQGFERLFPQTAGSLYGQSPHGTMAAFQRPTARSGIRGLYLAGGGTHPGAGVPMATLSARHAVEAIMSDRISHSPSRRTAMRGGMSTGSATMAPARSASSDS